MCKLVLIGAIPTVVALGAYFTVQEMRSARLQARYLAELGRGLYFRLEAGPNPSMRFPHTGPYDARLGHDALPAHLGSLQAQGFEIVEQARVSPRLANMMDLGLFPAYREKTQAGLTVLDRHGRPLFSARYPQRVYAGFDAIPPLLVDALLFIENRELLDDRYPTRNPAIEWDRLAKAVVEEMRSLLDAGHDTPGGSTLATQIEKYRHSPQGRTTSIQEKLRQMASASVRAYLTGEDTTTARRQLVVDYLNTVPLAAKAGYGEINGLGDGLWAWYGRDFGTVNRLLADVSRAGFTDAKLADGKFADAALADSKFAGAAPADAKLAGAALADAKPVGARLADAAQAGATRPDAALDARALAFKQALSLMIAQRRPSYYFNGHLDKLDALTDSHLRLLANAGVLSAELRDAALAQRLTLRESSIEQSPGSFVTRKAATATRTHLAKLLGTSRLYDLDRFDLTATSTLDAPVQQAITVKLRELRTPAAARAAGLLEPKLLERGDPAKVIYSFTLYERVHGANYVRVQTDNYDQPFDINEGTKLDLGSTAKLRTLITYLEIVAALHQRYGASNRDELRQTGSAEADPITRWALDYLAKATDRSLLAMLEAAMERRYSANPGERFFTGGGLHTFDNFNPEDDYRVLSVREGLRNSVNLVFVRLMRDIVRYHMLQTPGADPRLLEDPDDPRRRDYLVHFADREGREFVQRFYRKYRGKTPTEMEALLMQGVRPIPGRLASVFRSIDPDADADAFEQFVARYLRAAKLSEQALAKLYEQQSPERLNLADRGYIAGVHPLELWLVGYLREHPDASLAQVIEASTDERQAVYAWLFKTRHKNAQDKRIRTLLEAEGFRRIHQAWQRLGYPFDSLVPSYATALGASADRPAALAELMGILLDDGVRLPTARLQRLRFAAGTPYETVLAKPAAAGERVLPAEVAQVARRALAEVVEQGTARRLKGVFVKADGTALAVGGKTGTGDHRFDTYGKGGVLLSSRVVSRSGTFVFFIGERHFGTLTAYVQGPAAASYKFTSGLSAQILKVLAPALQPLLNETAEVAIMAGPGATSLVPQ